MPKGVVNKAHDLPEKASEQFSVFESDEWRSGEVLCECGRVHFSEACCDDDESQHYSRSEYDRLAEKQKSEPDIYHSHSDRIYFYAGCIGRVVVGCPCNHASRYEQWMLQSRKLIEAYFMRRDQEAFDFSTLPALHEKQEELCRLVEELNDAKKTLASIHDKQREYKKVAAETQALVFDAELSKPEKFMSPPQKPKIKERIEEIEWHLKTILNRNRQLKALVGRRKHYAEAVVRHDVLYAEANKPTRIIEFEEH